MKEVLAVTSSLLVGMGLLMLGAGLQGTLIGVRATLEGFSTLVIGAVMASYYVGYLAGSVAAPQAVHRVGHIRAFAALTAVASAAILLQSLFVHPLAWALLRAASGYCFAGIYVVAESWLNDRATNRTRAALLGVYMVVVYVGLAIGQFLLNLADPLDDLLFIVVAVLISLALVPIALTAQRAPEVAVAQRVSLRELARISPLGVVGVLFSGAAAGTVFSIGPVYATATGAFGPIGISTFMAAGILTAVLLQLPLGRLSDQLDRRTVLAAMSGTAMLAALAALSANVASPAFYAAAAVASGLSLTIYSLSASHVNDHLQPTQMVQASGTMILVNGVGAIAGPLAVSAAMQRLGAGAYFASFAVMHGGFALYTLWRKGRRAAVPAAEKSPYVAAQPQTAPAGVLTPSGAGDPPGNQPDTAEPTAQADTCADGTKVPR